MRGANGEAVGTGCLLEPTYKQPVATCLAMVGRIAIVEQHVLILREELIEDDERDGTDVRVVWRTYVVNLGDSELIGITTTNWIFLKETDTIEYASFCTKFIATSSLTDLVGGFGVDAFER